MAIRCRWQAYKIVQCVCYWYWLILTLIDSKWHQSNFTSAHPGSGHLLSTCHVLHSAWAFSQSWNGEDIVRQSLLTFKKVVTSLDDLVKSNQREQNFSQIFWEAWIQRVSRPVTLLFRLFWTNAWNDCEPYNAWTKHVPFNTFFFTFWNVILVDYYRRLFSSHIHFTTNTARIRGGSRRFTFTCLYTHTFVLSGWQCRMAPHAQALTCPLNYAPQLEGQNGFGRRLEWWRLPWNYW